MTQHEKSGQKKEQHIFRPPETETKTKKQKSGTTKKKKKKVQK
jgi:hypothetical protein